MVAFFLRKEGGEESKCRIKWGTETNMEEFFKSRPDMQLIALNPCGDFDEAAPFIKQLNQAYEEFEKSGRQASAKLAVTEWLERERSDLSQFIPNIAMYVTERNDLQFVAAAIVSLRGFECFVFLVGLKAKRVELRAEVLL